MNVAWKCDTEGGKRRKGKPKENITNGRENEEKNILQ